MNSISRTKKHSFWRTNLQKIKGTEGLWYVLPAVLLVSLIIIYPIIHQVYLSLFNKPFFTAASRFYGLGNYIDTFTSSDFWNAFLRTVIWTLSCTGLQFGLGFAAAIVFNERFRGRSVLRALLLIPWIIPTTIAAVTWRWMYHADFGIINSVLSNLGIISDRVNWLGDPNVALASVIAMNVWKMFPFVMLMIMAALQAIPLERYEAAWVDGANIFQTFWHVTFPAVRATSVTILLLLTIWSLNSFTFIFVMTQGGPLRTTELISMYIYRLAFQNFNFEFAAAGAIILFMIMFIFSGIYLKLFYKEGV